LGKKQRPWGRGGGSQDRRLVFEVPVGDFFELTRPVEIQRPGQGEGGREPGPLGVKRGKRVAFRCPLEQSMCQMRTHGFRGVRAKGQIAHCEGEISTSTHATTRAKYRMTG